MGAKSAVHFIVIAIFAIVGGVIFGSVAPSVLEWLFEQITHQNKTQLQMSPAAAVVPSGLLGVLLGSYLGVRFLRTLDRIGLRWDRMDAGDKVTFFVGIFAGLIASVPLLLLFQALDMPPLYRAELIVAVMVGFSALPVYALQSMAEILP